MEDFFVSGYRLLIVDDNAINRRVAISQFKSYKFDIDEAESGPEAISMCSQKHYDMILMDHMMPDMDGIEATGIIKEKCHENIKGTVFVALTANSTQDAKGFFLENGFDDFLEKPIKKDILFNILNRQIDDGRKEYYKNEAGDDTASKIKINNVNVEEGIKKAGGSLDAYMDVLDICSLSAPKKINSIKANAEACDYESYAISVHALKSTMTNIGAFELADMAALHEEAARDGNHEFVKENYTKLLDAYKTIISEIDNVIAQRT